jgi:quercetin dioxygenase-like cupin family protein
MSNIARLSLLITLVLTLAGLAPAEAIGQEVRTAPAVHTTFESHFTAPQPLPTGPLDHLFQVVDLAPGASTPIHSHEGPGFATVLRGTVTHQRLALGRDVEYPTGATWVELPQDIHFARDEAGVPATILASFILPRTAAGSDPIEDQPDPAPPAPTVPAIARVPIATAASGFEITQLVRTYDPGAATTSTLRVGNQALVLVTSGELTVREGKEARTYGPGGWWMESSATPTTSWNLSFTAAAAVYSQLTPLR